MHPKPSIRIYTASIAPAGLRVAGEVGLVASMEQLAARTTPNELRSILIQLNNDVTVQGIIVQMPLPAHLSQKMVIDTISSNKDIDGISPRSAGNIFLGLPSFLPATAAAVIEILERARVPLDGKRVVVISRSNVVGKPPFNGNISHRGWRVEEVRLPMLTKTHDATVIAQAEVEL